MSYVVLARKLRPRRFDDLVGQETIATILKNAILSERVSHAFLFTGSRGVGKTTAARILTKAINCLNPQEGNPCDECQNCKDITSNASPDVFEIDAASNRGIDNIRELRENTKYAPANCRYKVYIIDEAHMLTLESFNALLKTLEEPPPHVKFILATTDPHKVPQTIISRCQRYDFVRIPRYKIVDYLEQVTKDENIELSRHALGMVAQHAVGGMRDSLTAIDQILSYTGDSASDEDVAQILGMIDSQTRFRLLQSILRKNPTEALEQFYSMQEHGHDFQDVLSELLQSVKNLSLVHTLLQQTGKVPPTLFQDLPNEELQQYQELVASITLDELQQIFQILLELEERIKRSTHAQVCFEMALVQMTAVTPLIGIDNLLHQVRHLKQGLPEEAMQLSEPSATYTPKAPSSQAPPATYRTNASSPETNPAPSPAAIPSVAAPGTMEASLQKPEEKPVAQPQPTPTIGPENMQPTAASTFSESLKPEVPAAALVPTPETQATAPIPTPDGPSVSPVPEPKPESGLPKDNDSFQMPSQEWEAFVQHVQNKARLLGSHLKQATSPGPEGTVLRISFQDSTFAAMISQEQQKVLSRFAEEFYHRPMQVVIEKKNNSHSLTIAEKKEKMQKEEKLRREKEVEDSDIIQMIQNTFPGSNLKIDIRNIKI